MPPVEEWLKQRLTNGPAPSATVVAEARNAGYSIGEILIGKKSLGIVSLGEPASWGLPGSTLPVPVTTPKVVKPKKPADHYRQKAYGIISRATPRAARRLAELMEPVRDGGPACPSCGRGMPRPDDIILKAATAVADRGGLSPAKAATDSGDAGPMIVIPAGSRVAIAVEVPGQGLRLTAGPGAGPADGLEGQEANQ